MKRKEYTAKCRNIVIKIGTRGFLEHYPISSKMVSLAEEISRLNKEGYKFTIVSSGAVGLGMKALNLSQRPVEIRKIQALAAIGQNLLINYWNSLFAPFQLHVGQVLLTYDAVESRKRFLHARDCINTIRELNAIPIINENDSVAVDELKFGDNDRLSALTCLLTDAELLILFTDTDGIYDKNPNIHSNANRISIIENIDDSEVEIEDKKNSLSTGGMEAKLNAVADAVKNGVSVVMSHASNLALKEILQGEKEGSFFIPHEKKLKGKKKWIFSHHRLKGKVIIDSGAEKALLNDNKSLLPKGIVHAEGSFDSGMIIGIYNEQDELVAKGITYYSREDIDSFINHSAERRVIGKQYYDEVIHRDNMIVLTKGKG